LASPYFGAERRSLSSYVLQVDFEQVPDLVATRKVFLRHGQAYVFKTDAASLVVGHFRYSHTGPKHLQAGLLLTQLLSAVMTAVHPVQQRLIGDCLRVVIVPNCKRNSVHHCFVLSIQRCTAREAEFERLPLQEPALTRSCHHITQMGIPHSCRRE